MKKLLLSMLSLIVSVGVSAEKLHMDFSNLNTGWGSSYEASTKTITFESAWQGRGWWFGSGASAFDASKYSQFVLEIEPTTFTVAVQVVYGTKKQDKPQENESTSANVAAGGSKIVVTLDETMKNNIEQVYIQSDAAGDVVLKDAYFYREGPQFPVHNIDIDYSSGISLSSLEEYPDNATVTVVLNHAENKKGWGVAAIYNWSSQQTYTFYATSNGASSTYVFTMAEFRAFAGESNGFGLNMWDVGEESAKVSTTVESVKVSLNTVTISLTSAGIGSMILPFAAAVPEGMTVYEVGSCEDNVLHLNSVDAIAANTPYIIKGDAKDYTFVGVAEAQNFQYTVGNLCGTYESVKAPEGSYVLQKKDGEEAGFYHVASGSEPTVTAYHAYLTDLPVVAEGKLCLVFDDETTGIDRISSVKADGNMVYNLNGQRVSRRSSNGIVIINGKKYLVK